MDQKNILIIGGGNLGSAIAEGLLNSGFLKPQQLSMTRRHVAALEGWAAQGVKIGSDNRAAAAQADWIILAIKPFQVKEVLAEIQPVLQPHKQVLVSVATGVWVKDIREMVGDQVPVFRAMPNTAIALQESMTCICSSGAGEADQAFATALFNTLGKTLVIEEKLMDAATVLGACGTAFALRFIRANIQGGIEIGFSAAQASLIAAQTVKGAADLLLQRHAHPEQEIDKVTTPKGCTIAGLNEMEHQGFSSSLIKGVVTSYKKIIDDM